MNITIHAAYILYMSSEKEAAFGLPQLGLRFFSDSNSWNVNGKLQRFDADAQEY